jgi:cytochrome c oxidase assembly protein subunit 15
VRVPTLRPETYRRITVAAAVLLGIIIVTGAAVRLSGSGLGCPVGISCPKSQLLAHGTSDIHSTIEHLNRLFTGLVSVAVIVAVLGSLRRVPRRRDLVWLSVGLVVGVVVQAVLGQLTVEFDLTPHFVMAHFLVSAVLLADALVLVRRAGQPDGPARRVVTRRVQRLAIALVSLAGVVLFTGTIVTGTGPHSGGSKTDHVTRLDIPIVTAARVHSGIVWLLVATALVTAWYAARERAPDPVRRRVVLLLAVIAAQGAVGYIQYFTDLPAWLVGVHVAGAATVWTVTLLVLLATTEHEPAPAVDTDRAVPSGAAVAAAISRA